MDRSDPSKSGAALAYGIANYGLFLGILIFAVGFLASARLDGAAGRPFWQVLGELVSAISAMLALSLGQHQRHWRELASSRSLSRAGESC